MQVQRLTLIAFAISTILGGSNAIAVRLSNAEIPPFLGAAVRFLAASLILFLIVLARQYPLPKGRSLAGVLVFGTLQFGISYALGYWCLQYVPAGLFQVGLALVPLFTFFLAIAHRQETFQWKVLAGSVIAVIGIAIIFRGQLNANVPMLPMLAILLVAACFAESIVLFKTFPESHPVTTNALAMGTGAVILVGISWLTHETPRWPAQTATWIALLYLILLGSIATFILVLYVLARWTASISSYQLVLMPIVTVLLASWRAHEAITLPLMAGGLLVLAGVYIGALAPPDLIRRIFSRRSGAPVSNEPG